MGVGPSAGFGLGIADFLLCSRCGVYIGARTEIAEDLLTDAARARGISDDPLVHASGSSTKPNSAIAHKSTSLPRRERWVRHVDAAAR